MLHKLNFYDDPFSEMETLDAVDSLGGDDDFLSEDSGENVAYDKKPKASKRSSTRGRGKKRSGQGQTRAA